MEDALSLVLGVMLVIVGIAFLGDLILFLPVFLARRYEWEIPLHRYLTITFVSIPLTILGFMGGYALLRKWYKRNYR